MTLHYITVHLLVPGKYTMHLQHVTSLNCATLRAFCRMVFYSTPRRLHVALLYARHFALHELVLQHLSRHYTALQYTCIYMPPYIALHRHACLQTEGQTQYTHKCKYIYTCMHACIHTHACMHTYSKRMPTKKCMCKHAVASYVLADTYA